MISSITVKACLITQAIANHFQRPMDQGFSFAGRDWCWLTTSCWLPFPASRLVSQLWINRSRLLPPSIWDYFQHDIMRPLCSLIRRFSCGRDYFCLESYFWIGSPISLYYSSLYHLGGLIFLLSCKSKNPPLLLPLCLNSSRLLLFS